MDSDTANDVFSVGHWEVCVDVGNCENSAVFQPNIINKVNLSQTGWNGAFKPFEHFGGLCMTRGLTAKFTLKNGDGLNYPEGDSAGLCARFAEKLGISAQKSSGSQKLVLVSGRYNFTPLESKLGVLRKTIYAAYNNVPLILNFTDAEELKKTISSDQFQVFQCIEGFVSSLTIEDQKSRELNNLLFNKLQQPFDSFENFEVAVEDRFIVVSVQENLMDGDFPNERHLLKLGLTPYKDSNSGAKSHFGQFYEKIIPKKLSSAKVSSDEWEVVRSAFLEEQSRRELIRGRFDERLIDKFMSDKAENLKLVRQVLAPGDDDKHRHIIIAAPTGSGKTEVACALLVNKVLSSVSDGASAQKGLYLGPIKALIEQTGETLQKRFGKLISCLITQNDTPPVIVSTGENNIDDGSIRYSRNDYLIASVVNEKANLFALDSIEFTSSLRCVVIDEIHMIAHAGRPALERLIGKLKFVAKTRNPDEAPLTIIVVTTESSNFQTVFEENGKSPLVFESDVRPVPALHKLVVMDRTMNLTAQNFANNSIKLALMENNSNRYQPALSFKKNVIEKLQDVVQTIGDNKCSGESNIGDYLDLMKEQFGTESHSSGSDHFPSSILICLNDINLASDIAKKINNHFTPNSLFTRTNNGIERTNCLTQILSDFDQIIEREGLTDETKQVLLACKEKGIFFHHNQVSTEYKAKVVELFENPDIGVLLSENRQSIIVITTETLSYGLNLSTDLLLLLNYKFRRDENQPKVLNAHEVMNMLGRCGRLLNSKKRHAEVYICLSMEETLNSSAHERYKSQNSKRSRRPEGWRSRKLEDWRSSISQDLLAFLYGTYCKLEYGQSDRENIEQTHLKQSSFFGKVAALKKTKSTVLAFKGKSKSNLTLQYLAEKSETSFRLDQFNEWSFNNLLHSFLDAIWFSSMLAKTDSENEHDDITVLLTDSFSQSLFRTVYANRTFYRNPFNDIDAEYPERNEEGRDSKMFQHRIRFENAIVAIGKHILGYDTFAVRKEGEYGRGQHENIYGLRIVDIDASQSNERYSITPAGQSLLATGCSFNTAKAIEFWVRALSDITRKLEVVPIEFMLTALVYPHEIYSQMASLMPEYHMFRGSEKNEDVNWSSAMKELIKKNRDTLLENLRIELYDSLQRRNPDLSDELSETILENLARTISWSLDKSYSNDSLGFLSEDLNIYLPSNGSLRNQLFESKDPDSKQYRKLVKESIFYRSLLMVLAWINNSSLEHINTKVLSISDRQFEVLAPKEKSEYILKSKRRREFFINSNVHNQLIYKAYNAISYFYGKLNDEDNFGKYAVIAKLDLNASEFERRIRFGCKQHNLPIASALRHRWSRHSFTQEKNSKRAGYVDLFDVVQKEKELCGQPVNGVKDYWKSIELFHLKSFRNLKSALLIQQNEDSSLAFLVTDLWEEWEDYLSFQMKKYDSKESFCREVSIKELQRARGFLRDVLNEFFGNESPLFLEDRILFHGQSYDPSKHKISIYAFLCLITLLVRDLYVSYSTEGKESARQEILNSILENGDEGRYVTIKILFQLPCWNHSSSVVKRLQASTNDFNEPLPQKEFDKLFSS